LASAQPEAKARWATLVLLVVVAAGFALRTARRNLDWRDDASLWQAATEVCPASYKSWQGLATALAALPAGDPRASGIDRVVELQEHAVDILERNAPPDAPFPAFVLERLGLFLLEKTRAVVRQESAGEVPAGTSAIWASKAADALGRAVEEYDRETERRRASASGAGDVLEIGTLRVHLDHGAALLQLGRNEEALVAFQRARRLVPISAEAHLDVSAAHAALGRDEEALIDTLQALLVESQRTDLQARIFALYQRVDPGGCGFTREGGQVVVHPDCPAAHRLVCRAYGELLRTLASASNVPLAEREAAIARYRKGAEDGFRCAALDAPPGA
jgi:tetratricopeptide (TPR) repeat protein